MQVYNAQDEMDEWEVHKKLKGEYGLDDDSKEWLMAHLKKWKLIKQQAGKAAAASGRGGGGSGKKQAFSWKYVADIKGEGLTLGGVWTRDEAARHFDLAYKFENDNPRGGNVSINSEVYKCRKYIADSGDNERVYVRIVEMAEGTHYKIEQGYPLGDGDGDDDDVVVSGAPSKVASEDEDEEAAKGAVPRVRKAAGAPAPAPAVAPAAAGKKRRK